MKKKIGEELEKNQILLLFIPATRYDRKLIKVIEYLSKIFDSICYVTLRKPASTLEKLFRKSLEKIYFIDATPESEKNKGEKVFTVPSPRALTELGIVIDKVVRTKKIKVLVFDSISTLSIYEDNFVVTRFSHSLINSLRIKGIKGLFFCRKEDSKTRLIKDILMFVDNFMSL